MRRLIPVLTGALALAVSLIVLSAGARTQTGVPVFPLDDSYIHLQYGWQAAQGEWLQYNAGAAPTSGATSLLYMLLLAAGFAAGISQSAMPAVLLGLNMTAFVLSAALTAQMAGRLADCLNDDRMPPERFALFGGMLFAGSGWMAWAALSGMETMLLVLFVTLTLWGVLAENATVRSIGLFLATLTRPETVLLGGVVALSELLPEGDERWLDRLPRAVLAGLPALGVLASPILNWIVTGSPGSTGLLAKTWFTLVPFFPGEVITAIANIIAELFVWLLGGPTETRGWIVLPLGQIIAAIGVLLLWRTHRPLSRRLVVVTAGWVVLGVLATATLQTATWHNYRYQMPLYPALILLMTAGLIGLIGWIAHRSGRLPIRVVYYGALVFALGWAVWSVSTFRSAYARDTTTALTMQIRMANWLQANTNPDALVAVHDVGIMRFYGERPTLDVVGLTSDGMVEAHRNGPGTLYEALETARVDYYAVYPQQAPPYFGIEAAADLFGETLLRIEEPGCSDVTNADCVKAITQPDWDGLASGVALPQQPSTIAHIEGWDLMDTFDVAAVTAEQTHGYTWWNQSRRPGFASDVRVMAYREDPAVQLADGGRLLDGGERFTLETRPGEPLLLVARLHARENLTLAVAVDGQPAASWQIPAIPGEWLERWLLIPADRITGEQTTITLTLPQGTTAYHSPFHYWAYQGGDLPAVEPGRETTGVTFGDVVTLGSYDPPPARIAAGQTFTLRLVWQVDTPPAQDLNTFVHLVDPQNDTTEGILAQADRAPNNGTYPLRIWSPGEQSAQTFSLTVPPDTPPGEYLVLVGLYNPASGERLPLPEDYGSRRFLIAAVQITN